MSWLSELTNSFGSMFDSGSTWGDDISNWLNVGNAASTAVDKADVGGKGHGIFGSDTGFYSSLITAGAGLAGNYFSQKQERKLADEYMKQRQAELDYQKSLDAQNLALGYAKIKAQRKQTLAQLYASYGQSMGEAARANAAAANATASNIGDAINTRSKVLV